MPKLHAEGIYTGTVTNVETGFSSQKGTPQIVVTFDIPDLDTIMAKYLYTSDAALPWTLKSLDALGFVGDDFEDATLQQLVGKKCNCVIKNKPDQDGHPRSEIAFLNKIGGSGKPMDAGQKAAFNASMKERIAAARAAESASSGSAEQTEVPFNV
jgi:hypothetical protein